MAEAEKKLRIVIADDHAVVREGTRNIIEREPDMEVVGAAADGEEAVRLIEKYRPDVAVLDIAMPKLNGIEVIRKIKVTQPKIAVLILTGYDNDEYIFALLEAGAAGYLLKDVSGRDITQAIRSVYSGESVLHPSIARKVIRRAVIASEKPGEVSPDIELSEREIEVLKLAAKGLSNKDISDSLCISIRTVQGHIHTIFHKLNVGSRTEAVFQSIKKGLLSFEDLAK